MQLAGRGQDPATGATDCGKVVTGCSAPRVATDISCHPSRRARPPFVTDAAPHRGIGPAKRLARLSRAMCAHGGALRLPVSLWPPEIAHDPPPRAPVRRCVRTAVGVAAVGAASPCRRLVVAAGGLRPVGSRQRTGHRRASPRRSDALAVAGPRGPGCAALTMFRTPTMAAPVLRPTPTAVRAPTARLPDGESAPTPRPRPVLAPRFASRQLELFARGPATDPASTRAA